MTDAERQTLASRMKEAEHAYRRILPNRQYTLLRLDGRAFHTYTRALDRPFDRNFMDAMDQTLLALCDEIPGVRLGYVESDEISLLVTDWRYGGPSDGNPSGLRFETPWMGGVEAKMLSLSAARASVAFNNVRRHQYRSAAAEDTPSLDAIFDARLWTFPATDGGRAEVANYFLWRQRDSVKNSVTMAALEVFGHSALHGVDTATKQARLRAAGKDWELLPQGFQRGRIAVRRARVETIHYVDRRSGVEQTATACRTPFVIEDAPQFAGTAGHLDGHIPPPPPA